MPSKALRLLITITLLAGCQETETTASNIDAQAHLMDGQTLDHDAHQRTDGSGRDGTAAIEDASKIDGLSLIHI